MKSLATVTAALGLLGAVGAMNPAAAAPAQCFDAYGRPYGPPYDSSHPNYAMICQAFRMGGHCLHVDPQWAVNSCGLNRGSYYNRGHYERDSRPNYRSRRHDYDRRHRGDRKSPGRIEEFSPRYNYELQTRPQPNTAR
jgi:hypothetical protein